MMDLYAERTGEKITYLELARKTGIARATLEAIGSRPDYNTTLSTIDILCSFFNCSVSELLIYHPSQTNEE